MRQVPNPQTDDPAGHYQFLTIVSLWATQATMVLSLAALVVPALALPKTFLSVSVLPVEVLVSLLYWSLHFINPDLLVPPKMVPDPNSPGQMIAQRVHLPLDIDMSMHLAPAVILLAVRRMRSAAHKARLTLSLPAGLSRLLAAVSQAPAARADLRRCDAGLLSLGRVLQLDQRVRGLFGSVPACSSHRSAAASRTPCSTSCRRQHVALCTSAVRPR